MHVFPDTSVFLKHCFARPTLNVCQWNVSDSFINVFHPDEEEEGPESDDEEEEDDNDVSLLKAFQTFI